MFELSWTEVVTCVWVATVFSLLAGYVAGMLQGMASVRGPSLQAQTEYLAESRRLNAERGVAQHNAVTVRRKAGEW